MRLGGTGKKVVVNQAIDTLPGDLRAYFETSLLFRTARDRPARRRKRKRRSPREVGHRE